jgi:hypothetical protein
MQGGYLGGARNDAYKYIIRILSISAVRRVHFNHGERCTWLVGILVSHPVSYINNQIKL